MSKEGEVTVPDVDPRRARSLVERAAERFKVGEYTQANRLLDEAERADPDELVHEEIDRGRSVLREHGLELSPTDVEHGTASEPSERLPGDDGEKPDTGTESSSGSSPPAMAPAELARQDFPEQAALFDTPANPDGPASATKRPRKQRHASSAKPTGRDFEQASLFVVPP